MSSSHPNGSVPVQENPEELLDEKRRKALMDTIARGRSAGAHIPKEFMLDGRRIPLKAFISHILISKEEGSVSPGDRTRAEEMAGFVKDRIRNQMERLRTEVTLTVFEAAQIETECTGLNKALEILESVGRRRHPRHLRSSQVEDTRRWLNYGKQIAGKR